MLDNERIKQAVKILYPHTTHESHGSKMQQAVNDAFEILEWGHLIKTENNSDEEETK